MSDKPITYTFTTPIVFAGDTIKTLTFRVPRGKDIQDLDLKETQSVGEIMKIAARLTENVPTTFDDISVQDTMEIVAITMELLGGGQATGGSS